MPAPISSEARSDAQIPIVGLGVRGVCLTYHSNYPITKDLNTAITPDAATIIVSPNACGKSTLLRAMSRILSPNSGQMVLDGRDITTLAPKKPARRVGMLAQSSIAPPGITIHELVACRRYPCQPPLRQRSADDDAATTGVMERIDIVGLANRHVSVFSGGRRQRVWVAMVLAQRTSILLLDELTIYSDLAHQVGLLELCRDLSAELGTAIVVVLHGLNQACRYGDEMITMRTGSTLAHDCPEEVVTTEMVGEVFGLKAQTTPDPLTGTLSILPLPHGTATTTPAGEAG